MKFPCLLCACALMAPIVAVAQDQSVPTPTPVPMEVSGLLKQASADEASYKANSASVVGAEARRQEVLALLYAWALGDTSQDHKRKLLLDAVDSDTRLSSKARFVPAALVDSQTVFDAEPDLNLANYFVAYEGVARGLVSDFQDQSSGYEALLFVGVNSPDRAQIARIGSDLIIDQHTPAWVKNRAQTMLNRLDLVGLSLGSLLPESSVAEIGSGAKSQFLIYSWSGSSPDSQALAKILATYAPAETTIIGVCIDQQPDRSIATVLPGKQLSCAGGIDGLVAQRLMLDRASLAYLTDSNGILRSVTIPQDWALNR